MSLTRHFFREFRPFFHMLEEPLGRHPAYMGIPQTRSLLDDPFFHHPNSLRPAVDVSEQGSSYTIEADLPGVKKEDVQVRIGDAGQSVTIEGKIVDRRSAQESAPRPADAPANGEPSDANAVESAEGPKTALSAPESTQISSERSFVGSSTFTRTVWLPRRVDPSNVSAKLSDGVLTVTIPKAQDTGSVEVPVQ